MHTYTASCIYVYLLVSLTEKVLPANRTVGVHGVGGRSFRVRLAAHRDARSSSIVNVTALLLARRATIIASHRATSHRVVPNDAVARPRACADRD